MGSPACKYWENNINSQHLYCKYSSSTGPGSLKAHRCICSPRVSGPGVCPRPLRGVSEDTWRHHHLRLPVTAHTGDGAKNSFRLYPGSSWPGVTGQPECSLILMIIGTIKKMDWMRLCSRCINISFGASAQRQQREKEQVSRKKLDGKMVRNQEKTVKANYISGLLMRMKIGIICIFKKKEKENKSQIIKRQDAVMTSTYGSLCSGNWKRLQVSAAVIPCNCQRHATEWKPASPRPSASFKLKCVALFCSSRS